MVKTSSDPITVISLFLYHISWELEEEDDISSFDGDTLSTAYSLFMNTLTKGSGVLCHSPGHTGSLKPNPVICTVSVYMCTVTWPRP